MTKKISQVIVMDDGEDSRYHIIFSGVYDDLLSLIAEYNRTEAGAMRHILEACIQDEVSLLDKHLDIIRDELDIEHEETFNKPEAVVLKLTKPEKDKK